MTVSGCRLQEEYPHWFEKPVLEMVHHNTVSLDKLVEMAWVEILTKYAVGEECDFLVSAASDMLLCNQAFGAIHVIFRPILWHTVTVNTADRIWVCLSKIPAALYKF